MTEPHSFGAWLRCERERRAITLRTIADQTKIGARRLEALERGDISQWPGGIYRRAFARAYAEAIGLDADLVLANFERAFPSDPTAPVAAADVAASADESEMRLALVAPAVAGLTAPVLKTAARDLACIIAFGLAGFAVYGAIGLWCAAAIAALIFHLSRVLGLHDKAFWRVSDHDHLGAPETRAEVLSFSDEQVRSTSRRARAERMLANLSAGSSADISGRRRAART